MSAMSISANPLDGPCTKIRYEYKTEANAALLEAWLARARGHTNRREMSSYWCRFCRGFHLTHLRGKR